MRSRLASDRVVYFEFILPGMFKLAPFEYTHIHTHTHRGGQLAGECIVTGMLKNKITDDEVMLNVLGCRLTY